MDTHYQISVVYWQELGVHWRFMGKSSLFYTEALFYTESLIQTPIGVRGIEISILVLLWKTWKLYKK